jgi:tRNA 2-thiouridine synthesizing protein A
MADDPQTPLRPIRCIDVTGSRCPMTFVRVKVALDRIDPGQAVEFVLSEGEQMQDVPQSLKAEGHRIVEVRRDGAKFHLLVWKGGR